MQVQDLMARSVIGIEPSASIGDAAKLMIHHHISGLPVLHADGSLVGIVSEGDFLRRSEFGSEKKRSRWLEFLVSPGKLADEYIATHGRKVEEVMTTNVVTVSPGVSLDAAIELMIAHNIKRLPVVENGKVVGLVARSDLLRALLLTLPQPDPLVLEDERIRVNILRELSQQKWTGNSLIRVDVDHGAVQLSGTIFDDRERQAARVLAENVPGVKSVTDQMAWIEPMSGMVIFPT